MRKKIHFCLSLFIILLGYSVHAQDTLSVYFDFGKSKISSSEAIKVNNLPVRFNFSELDSILFVGMADSIGNFRSNLKLSEKRAKNVSKELEEFFPENFHPKIVSLGEKVKDHSKPSRRVDILMFFHPVIEQDTNTIECGFEEQNCFLIDYALLRKCRIHQITKKKKEFVILEHETNQSPKNRLLYYGSLEEGQLMVKKVKWKTKKTGKLWWTKKRNVATIPKESFERFRIFEMSSMPCDTCSEDFVKQPSITKIDSCFKADLFLMSNLQYKFKLFNKEYVKIRVPREYVDLNERYFSYNNKTHPLNWGTKNLKRHRPYYYSVLPRKSNWIESINRYFECCKYNRHFGSSDSSRINCGTILYHSKPFKLSVEMGSLYQSSEVSPYLGLAINREGQKSRLNLLLGTTINLHIVSSLSYQFHFLSYPARTLSSFSKWKESNHEFAKQNYGRVYLGSEINSMIESFEKSVFTANCHLGWSLESTSSKSFVSRIFIHAGYGTDLADLTNVPFFFPTAKLGLNFSLKKQ